MVDLGQRTFYVAEASLISGRQSAQRAEIIALTRALEKVEVKRVNIYTDSAYTAGVVHVELPCWIRNGFVTSTGTPIKHQDDITNLYAALMLPKQVAVIKCKAHTGGISYLDLGNQAADATAKEAAGYKTSHQMVTVEEKPEEITIDLILKHQAKASPEEKASWCTLGKAVKDDAGMYRHPKDGRPIPSLTRLKHLLKEAHGPAHHGQKEVKHRMRHWYHPCMRSIIKEMVESCEICNQHNARKAIKTETGKFDLPPGPNSEVVIDFTDMINTVGGKRYLLVMVDAYTKWPEAYPTRKEDALSVIKSLVNHYIPTHGFPKRIRSDNGSHFKNEHFTIKQNSLR